LESTITDKIEEFELRLNILERKILAMENLLSEYFPLSIEKILERKGLKIARSDRDIPVFDREKLYLQFKSYYFRRTLHDLLFLKKIDQNSRGLIVKKWGKNVDSYLDVASKLGIIRFENNIYIAQYPVSFMGILLEWFIGKFLREELNLETVINVRLKNLPEGGDIDILSRIGKNIVMIECKESPPNNIPVSELKAIRERVKILKPDIFLLAIDTTLSIKRNIVDNLQWILKSEIVRVKEGVYKASNNFFIVTAKRDLLQNIAFCITEA